MKILLKVLGTILAAVALIVCFGGVIRNMGDANDSDYVAAELERGKAQFKEMQESMNALGGDGTEMEDALKDMEETANGIPSKSEFQTACAMMVILGLISIALIIFQYTGSVKATGILLVLTLITGILAIVLSPVVPETLTGGISNRKFAVIAAVPAIAAAITAFLVARMKRSAVAVPDRTIS